MCFKCFKCSGKEKEKKIQKKYMRGSDFLTRPVKKHRVKALQLSYV